MKNQLPLFFALFLLSLSYLAADDFETQMTDTSITLFINGYQGDKNEPTTVRRSSEWAISQEGADTGYFEADDTLRNAYKQDNVYEYQLGSGTYHDSNSYLREIGDFNTGANLEGGISPESRQPFLGLAKSEWTYRNSTILKEKVTDPETYEGLIEALLKSGPRFYELLINPTWGDTHDTDDYDISVYKVSNIKNRYLENILLRANVGIPGDINVYELALELHKIAQTQTPNKFKFFVHSMGGMYGLRYLTEHEDSEFGFYRRYSVYDHNDYEYDVEGQYGSRYTNLLNEPYMDGTRLEEILKKERENSVIKFVTLDSPLSGSYAAQLNEELQKSDLGSKSIFKVLGPQLIAPITANMFISSVMISSGSALLIVPGMAPVGAAMIYWGSISLAVDSVMLHISIALTAVELTTNLFSIDDIILGPEVTDTIGFSPDQKLFPELKHFDHGGTLVKSYMNEPPPTLSTKDDTLIEIDTIGFTGAPSFRSISGFSKGNIYESMKGDIVLGVYQHRLFWNVFAGSMKYLFVVFQGQNAPAMEELVLPHVLHILGIKTRSGSFVMNKRESSGQEIPVINNNPVVNMFRVDTSTRDYKRNAEDLLGGTNRIPERNWSAFFPDIKDSVLNDEWFQMHGVAQEFMAYPIVAYERDYTTVTDDSTNEDSTDKKEEKIVHDGNFYFSRATNPDDIKRENISPIMREITVLQSANKDFELPDDSFLNSLSTNTWYEYFARGFALGEEHGINVGARNADEEYGNNSSIFTDNTFSARRGLSTAFLSDTPNETAAAAQGIAPDTSLFDDEYNANVTVDALNYQVIANYVYVLPLNIIDNYPGIDLAFSINGGEFISAESIDRISGFNELSAYGQYMKDWEDSRPHLAFNETGSALLVSPRFKEGYNSVVFRFRDGFGGEIYKDMILMQLTIPPFLKPVYPLMNQYVGQNSLTLTLQALDISDGAVKPEDWFLDAQFTLTVDGIPQGGITRNPDTFTISAPLAGLEEGNHVVEVTTNVYGLENATAFRFWVDTTAPEITFPRDMRFTNMGEKFGGVATHIADNVPYHSPEIDYDVDTVLLSDLDIAIKKNGFTYKEIKSAENTRLGAYSSSWNGMYNGSPLDHGIYDLEVTASDRVGNKTVEKGSVIIDNMAPYIDSVSINTSLVNLNTGLLEIDYRLLLDSWEKEGTLEAEFSNLEANESFSMTTTTSGGVDENFPLAYFVGGVNVLKDGFYDLKVFSSDDLGNKGTPVYFNNIIIDRTRPKIVNAYAAPFILDESAHSVSIHFSVNEENDAAETKSSSLDLQIDLLNAYGEIVNDFVPSAGSIGNESDFEYSLELPSSLRDGKYFFRVSVTDIHGNTREELIPVVKNAVPPEITYPEKNDVINGVTTIHGNIIDPRFSNDQDFDHYEMYYRAGSHGLPANLGDLSDWESEYIKAPDYQQDDSLGAYCGRFVVEGGNPIGYIDTSFLPDGLVTVLVVAEEADGYRIGTTRTFRIMKSDENYVVNIDLDPEFADGIVDVDFNEDDQLSVGYSVEHALDNPVDIYTFVKNQEGQIVKRESMYNLHSKDITGRPSSLDGTGTYVYQNDSGKIYIELHNGQTEDASFVVMLDASEAMTDFVDLSGSEINSPAGLIDDGKSCYFNAVVGPGETYALGFDLSEGTELNITSIADNLPSSIFLGENKVLEESGKAEIYPGSTYPPLLWDGQDEFGRYVTNGVYTLGIEAFGELGGQDNDSLEVTVSTPYFMEVDSIDNKDIQLGGSIQNLSNGRVYFNKPGTVSVAVIDEDGNTVSSISPEPQILDNPGYVNFTWDGTDSDGNLVTLGSYSYRITGNAKDGSDPILANGTTHPELAGILVSIASELDPSIKAELSLESDIEYNGLPVLQGDTSYQALTTAEGQYLPERDVELQIEGTGTQVVAAYPDMNYMAAFRTNYEKLFAAAGPTQVMVDAYYKRDILDGHKTDHDVVVSINPNSYNLSGLAMDYNLETDTLNTHVITGTVTATGIASVRGEIRKNKKPFGYKEYNFDHLKNINSGQARVINGRLYASSAAFTNLSIISNSKPDTGSKKYQDISVTVRGTITIYLKYGGNPDSLRPYYFSAADAFAFAGPDADPSAGYAHQTDFVHSGEPVTLNNFVTDPISSTGLMTLSNKVNVDRRNPRYYLYYIGENYQNVSNNASPNPSVQDLFGYDGYPSIHGSRGSVYQNPRYQIPSDFQSVTLRAPDSQVVFNLSKDSSGYYDLSVESLAEDRILYAFPATEAGFYTSHSIGDSSLGIPITSINGVRDNLDSTPNFFVPEYRVGEPDVKNIYFDSDNNNQFQMTTPLTHSFESGYEGFIGKTELNLLADFPEIVNILNWKILNAASPSVSFKNLVGTVIDNDFSTGDNYLITDDKIASISDAAWDFADDENITGNTLFSPIYRPDLDDLNRYGKVREVCFSDIYPFSGLEDLSARNLMLSEEDGTRKDNSNIVILPGLRDYSGKNEESKYTVNLRGIDGNTYSGLDISNIAHFGRGLKLSDAFVVALDESAMKKLIPVYGLGEGDISLAYYDKDGIWRDIPIYNSDPSKNLLTYWDITGLNGQYTVRIISSTGDSRNVGFQNIYIGQLVNASEGDAAVTSTSGQAKLIFPQGTVQEDLVVNIDAIDYENINDIEVLPDLSPVGKIVRLSPDGQQFPNASPQLQFTYNKEQISELGINPLELIIYHLKESGELVPIPTIKQMVKVVFGDNGEIIDEVVVWDDAINTSDEAMGIEYTYLRVWSELSHFSYYVVLEGRVDNRPILEQPTSPTGAFNFTLSGSGDPGKTVNIYSSDSQYMNPKNNILEPIAQTSIGSNGLFQLEEVPLHYEGRNFLYAAYDGSENSSYSKLIVTRDTTAPVLWVDSYTNVISPNSDDLMDQIEVDLTTNEMGMVRLELIQPINDAVVLEKDVVFDSSSEYFPNGETFRYQGEYILDGLSSHGSLLNDGSYGLRITAYDNYGNSSDAYTDEFIIDTEEPGFDILIENEKISPSNQDGMLDSSDVTLSLSEPSDVKIWIGRSSEPYYMVFEDTSLTDNLTLTANWDGKNSLGEYAPDGRYYFTVRSADAGQNVSEDTIYDLFIDVDNSAPEMELSILDNHVVKENKQVQVDFSLTERAFVQFRIIDKASETNIFEQDEEFSASSHHLYWTVEDVDDGEYRLEIVSTDMMGNVSPILVRNFTLVKDVFPPEIIGLSNLVVEATGDFTSYTLETPVVIDDSLPITITNNSPEQFPLGTTVVTWTASDRYDNEISMEQNITLVDTTAPEFLTIPETVIVETTSLFADIDVNDLEVEDAFPVTLENDAPSIFVQGTTDVLWTATDQNGNVSTIVQQFIVKRPDSDTMTGRWYHEDIGSDVPLGQAEFENDEYSIFSSGRGIDGHSDEFHFVYQQLSGDGTITARVHPSSNWRSNGISGLMIRQELDKESIFAALAVSEDRIFDIDFQWRESFGEDSLNYFNRHSRRRNFSDHMGRTNQNWKQASFSRFNRSYFLRLEREGNVFRIYYSMRGQNWKQLGSDITLPMEEVAYIGLIAADQNDGESNMARFTDVSVETPAPIPAILPEGWASNDIGNVQFEGKAGFESDAFILRGSGKDIGGHEDEFHYVYKEIEGDASIIAKVISQGDSDDLAKAGIMIRENLDGDSRFASFFQTPTGLLGFNWRKDPGAQADGIWERSSNGHSFNEWFSPWLYNYPSNDWDGYYLKIERRGNMFRTYRSLDKNKWDQLGDAVAIGMQEKVYIGLAVTSHNKDALSRVSFESVVVEDIERPNPILPEGFRSLDIGNVNFPGYSGVENEQFILAGSGDGIGGKEDAFHFMHKTMYGDTTIIAEVSSLSLTDGNPIAGIMIRENLGAGSPNISATLSSNHGLHLNWRKDMGEDTAVRSLPYIGYRNRGFHNYWGSHTAAPALLKIEREGDIFRTYMSFSKSRPFWFKIGEIQLPDMGERVYVGLAVSGDSDLALSRAVFKAVIIE